VSDTRRRALVGLLLLALLLATVAIASTGSVPTGTGGARRPSDRFFDVLLSLVLLWLAFGVFVWGYLLLIRKDALAMAVADRRRRNPWVTVIGFAVGFAVLAVLIRWASVSPDFRKSIAAKLGRAQRGKGGPTTDPSAYDPQFAAGPVIVVLVIVAIAVVALYLSHRARRRRLTPPSAPLAPTLEEVLEETLDDLRNARDPRQAVIAAYARMERALAAYGLPRKPAEAPDEYLQRIFADLDVSHRSTARLTTLFAWAKFSAHEVAPEMKQEAIESLESVLDELRAAEILAEEQRLAARAALRERAGH